MTIYLFPYGGILPVTLAATFAKPTLIYPGVHFLGCPFGRHCGFPFRLETTERKSFQNLSFPKNLARTLLVAPGLTTRSKKLLVTKGIATSSKDATSSSWPYY